MSQELSPEVREFEKLTKQLKARLVDTSQAAKFLHCSVQKLHNDRWKGVGLPYYKFNSRCYYDIRDLKQYFKTNMQRIVPGVGDA